MAVGVHNARRVRAIRVDKVCVGVGRVIRPLDVTITQWVFDGIEGWHGLAVPFQPCLALIVSSYDRFFDLRDGLDVRFRNDQRVDKVGVGVGRVVRSLDVTITQWGLDSVEGWHGLAIPFQPCLALIVGSYNRLFDFRYSFDVGLRDDQRHGVLRGAVVDRLSLPHIGKRPAG